MAGAKDQRQYESWHRRGHAVSCWQYHERCALISARDLLENRAAHAKSQAGLFRDSVNSMDRSDSQEPEEALLEQARQLLRDYHAALRAGRER